MRNQLAHALILVMVALGCRGKAKVPVDEPPRLPEVPAAASVQLDAPPAAPSQPQEVQHVQPQELKGFNLNGEASCFPLPANRRCIARASQVADACRSAHGELLVCEDCRHLCSKMLKP